MNQELYIQLKTILKHYEFNDQANLFDLFRYAKRAGLRGVSFKEFCKHVRNMGVSSNVARVDSKVTRSLKYYPMTDQYLKTVFPVFETCPTCKGSGVVKIDMS